MHRRIYIIAGAHRRLRLRQDCGRYLFHFPPDWRGDWHERLIFS
jgi:hypothetical protein